ncbi:MAG: hypothetical protein AB7G75_01310 [Candidatus Binatia bacterium]
MKPSDTQQQAKRKRRIFGKEKRAATQALATRFPEKSPINFHNTPFPPPLSEVKKAM